jgi:hypothetical protein
VQCGCHGGEEQEQRASLSHVWRSPNQARMLHEDAKVLDSEHLVSKLCVAASHPFNHATPCHLLWRPR